MNPVSETNRSSSNLSEEIGKFVTSSLFITDDLFHIQLELI